MRTGTGIGRGWRLPLLLLLGLAGPLAQAADDWSDAELDTLRSLWLGNAGPPPEESTNRVAETELAAKLGHRLFFDARLSGNGAVACATCHQPARNFTDGLPRAVAMGQARRNTPSIIGAVYSPWLYWDGRRDSLWSQALTPLEDPNEHGTNRNQVVEVVANDAGYRSLYTEIFGEAPDLGSPAAVDRSFANIGKAIGAYERLLVHGPSRFDAYVEAVLAGQDSAALDADEIDGLRLFIGKAECTQCHNGPLFTNNEFHNTGLLSIPGEVPDKGRVDGVRQVLANPFNCLGEFSDAPAGACAELEFVQTGPQLVGAFRTPSLRNLDKSEPFMHQGQLETLADVLQHYNEAPEAMIGHSELEPLGLSGAELEQLEAFLLTLAAPPATAEEWLRPPD